MTDEASDEMSQIGGDEMSLRRSSTSAAAGSLDDEDLLVEILIRLSPLPSSLPRASLVCQRWRHLVTDASFLRLFRARHRKAPILGVFAKDDDAGEIVFTSVLDPPDRIPTERFSLRVDGKGSSDTWSVLGSRHGLVLVINWTQLQLVVFHPVSGERRTLAVPSEFAESGYLVHNGALLCAAGDGPDHVHGDCHLRPFKVVLVGSSADGMRHPAVAGVYSSATGMWGDLVTTTEPCTGGVTRHPCTISGNAIYWCLNGFGDGILEFDLDKHSLTVIDRPLVAPVPSNSWIIQGEDGGVGIALLWYPDFEIWDRKVNHHGSATWVLRKTTSMNGLLGPGSASAHIRGYDEDTDAIFMSMNRDPHGDILIIVQLESMRVKECRGSSLKDLSLPFTDFYTAARRHIQEENEEDNEGSEEEGSEEGSEEEDNEGMSATEQTFYANHQLLSYRTDMKHRSYMYAVRHKNPPILRTRGSTTKLRISDKWIPRLSAAGLLPIARMMDLYECRFPFDHPLLSSLADRWQRTNTFHLPVGEMTITLEDVEKIFGLPLDGDAVADNEVDNWNNWKSRLLERFSTAERKEDAPPFVSFKDETDEKRSKTKRCLTDRSGDISEISCFFAG